jgi:TonB family protein
MSLTLITVEHKTESRVSTAVTFNPINIGKLIPARPVLTEFIPALITQADAGSPGNMIPPRPDIPLLDSHPFAQHAGLLPGTGVTVVLRVEVHGNGTVGGVQVEVSGGNRRIDDVAIAFVKTMKWVGGRVGNQPTDVWIRWGVRLDG